jgi:hypothetical protein
VLGHAVFAGAGAHVGARKIARRTPQSRVGTACTRSTKRSFRRESRVLHPPRLNHSRLRLARSRYDVQGPHRRIAGPPVIAQQRNLSRFPGILAVTAT